VLEREGDLFIGEGGQAFVSFARREPHQPAFGHLSKVVTQGAFPRTRGKLLRRSPKGIAKPHLRGGRKSQAREQGRP
jgi:hypothetical protein